MNRPDAFFYSIAFYSYLIGFLGYILQVSLKRDIFGKIATGLLIVGIIPHTIAFIMRWVLKGHVPLANMYEYMGIMAWMVIVGQLYFVFKLKNLKIGVFVTPIAVMLLVVASLLPSDINRQLMPALQSNWLAIHVSLAALGSGSFLIAFAASTLYLLSGSTDAKQLKNDPDSRQWKLFAIFWIGVPVLSALLLSLLGFLPKPVDPFHDAGVSYGSAITVFALGKGHNALFLGPAAIGLGIGMVLGSILWPFANRDKKIASDKTTAASRMFAVLVLAILLSAVIVGFLVKSNIISLTPRSYFKIFEFFGPTLVISWILTPIIHKLLLRKGQSAFDRLGFSRKLSEDISYRAVTIGYPLYTIGALFAGAIWAEQAWGTWWGWDPKEVGALIIWLFYTGFLHARFQRNWKGRRAAVLVVFGMVMVFISFFGNYFFGGLHSFEVS